MTTTVLYADDVPAARDWYTRLLDIEAYFQRPDADHPAYIEFRIGDYQHELGILDRRYAPDQTRDGGPGPSVTYWHVDDVDRALDRLVELGATVLEPRVERGPGFVTASVLEPFGNVLGVMYNRHYLDVLARRTTAGDAAGNAAGNSAGNAAATGEAATSR